MPRRTTRHRTAMMILALTFATLGCGGEQEPAPTEPPVEAAPPPAPPDERMSDPAANLPTDPGGVESAIAEHVGNGAADETNFGVDDPTELLPTTPPPDAGVAQVAKADALLQELKNHTRNKDFRAADQVYASLAPMMATLPEPMQQAITDAYDALVAARRQQAMDEGLIPVIPDDAELTK